MSDDKTPFLKRLLNSCLLILGAAIALNIAINLIKCIWPWLLAALLITGAAYVAWRVYRHRAGGW